MRYGVDCKTEDGVEFTCWVIANGESEALDKFKSSIFYRRFGTVNIKIIRVTKMQN